jgi:4-amino-4-deoxy-L-arabinose transferase-like glycosyltransferase
MTTASLLRQPQGRARHLLQALPVEVPRVVWVVAIGVAALLLATASAYGFHRDELYFIVAGNHPDFGYVDQPPITPLLSAAAAGLFGVTPFAVRLLPALAAAAIVVLAADMARRFGGSQAAQALAAVVVALSGVLGAGHLDETTTFDVFLWTLALWLFVPLLSEDPGGTLASQSSKAGANRWRWFALGVVVGLALENKTLAIALPLTLCVSLGLLQRRRVFRSPAMWLGASIAFLLWLPNILWQASHGFTQLTMAQRIVNDQGGIDGRLKAIAELLALAGPLVFPVAIAGVRWLLRATASRPWRPLGLAIVVQLGLMLAIGGKSYYSAGYLPVAMAAGAIPLAGFLERGHVVMRRATFGTALAVSGALTAVLLLPIVPVGALHETPIPTIYAESIAQVGWPELAAQVQGVADGLPPAQRASAVILTQTYGEYAALVLLGRGLPPVYSGHNSAADWGRPSDGANPVVVVAYDEAAANALFKGCRVAATIDNGYELETEEQGLPILVCAAPIRPWSELWSSVRHID